MQDEIMGLDKAQYNQKAARHSKANIFLWLIAGIVYNLYHSNLFSLSTLLFIMPGMFVISFASILTFFVNTKKHQIVPRTNNVLILISFTIWYFVDLVYPIVRSIAYVLLIEPISKALLPQTIVCAEEAASVRDVLTPFRSRYMLSGGSEYMKPEINSTTSSPFNKGEISWK
jgi:hypothetical protein